MRNGLDEEQKTFIRANAAKGGNWIANALNVNRQEVYNLGHREGFSLKTVREPKPVRATRNWPRHYRKYKKYLVMRDGLRCHYCEQLMTYDEAQVDHIKPKVRGGSDAPHNLVLACAMCNNLKSTLCYSCPEFRDAIGQ